MTTSTSRHLPTSGGITSKLTGEPATEAKYERFWRLGHVVTALAQAGLRVEVLDESPGNWRGTAAPIPGSFTLLASKGA